MSIADTIAYLFFIYVLIIHWIATRSLAMTIESPLTLSRTINIVHCLITMRKSTVHPITLTSITAPVRHCERTRGNTVIVNTFMTALLFTQYISPFSLMLDPAGDAKRPGRIVHDTFERGITLQFAEQLKKKLEALNPTIRTILTRFPGETVDNLQNAHFANRLAVDLYISIHFYQESETKPNLYLYYVSYNDSFITKSYDLCLYPYDQAHRINAQKTVQIAQCMSQALGASPYNRLYQCHGCFGLPIKPLIGIKSPALLIEASIKKSTDWHVYVDPVAQAIIQCMKQYETS